MPYITTDALDSILADHQDLDYDDDDDDGGADDNGKRSSRTSSTLDAKGDDDGAIIDAMEDDAPARDKAVSQNGESSTRGAVFDRFHWGFLTDERNPCGPFSVILSPSASERKALSKMVKDAFELRKYLQRKRGNTNTSEALKLFPDNHYSMPGMLMQELQRLNERRSTSNRNFWLYLPSTVVLSRSIPFPCKLIWYKGDASSLDCVTEALRLRNIYSKTFGWVARLAWEENAISSTRGYNNNDDGKNGDDNNNNNNNNNASSNAKDKKKDDTTAVAIAATENDQCTFTLHLHMPRARFPSSHRVCKASVNYAGFRTAVIGPGDAYDAFIAGFDRATGSSLVWGTGQLSILAGLSKTDKPRAAVIVRRTLAEIVLSLERQFTTVIITGKKNHAHIRLWRYITFFSSFLFFTLNMLFLFSSAHVCTFSIHSRASLIQLSIAHDIFFLHLHQVSTRMRWRISSKARKRPGKRITTRHIHRGPTKRYANP